MQNDFALVVSEGTVSTLSGGAIQGKLAVCAVRGGVAEIHVVWPSDVARIVGSLPVLPSMTGHPTALVSLEEELETMRAAEDAVREEITRLNKGAPAYFMPVEPMYFTGLKIMFQDHGIDFQLSSKLAKELLWRDGDMLRFASSIDGLTGVIYCDEQGSSLIESTSEVGYLEISSYLPKPDRVGQSCLTDWTSPTYWISEGRIYFDMVQFGETAAPTSDNEQWSSAVDVVESGYYRPQRSTRDDIIIGFCMGAFIMAGLALVSRVVFGA